MVNPDSNPTLSLSVYMFFGPALLWIGATLLLVRLRGGIVTWLARRATPGRATTMRGFLLASAGRRGAAINRGLVVVGLLLAFGVNLGIFTATYNQQALVDAQLTLGADVVATAPPGVTASHGLAGKIAKVPGVTATTAVDHSYAYVGPDLQDTYGIDASTFTGATTLRDSYFVGGTAQQTIARLKTTPDGILVSKETITDYQLKVGDLLRLRVLDHATGRFVVAPFHVVGVVQEFPSAPKDSFMVTNLPYLLKVTHDPGPNVVFAKTSGDPPAVAARVAQATAADGTTVKDITSQVAATVSSITTVDLTGISRIEEVFVVILAGRGHGPVRHAGPRRAPPRAGHDGGALGLAARHRRLHLERGGADPRRRHRARGRPRLAALGAARGDAPARVRPATGLARRALALPRRPRRGRGARRRRGDRPGGARLEAHAARFHTAGAMSLPAS